MKREQREHHPETRKESAEVARSHEDLSLVWLNLSGSTRPTGKLEAISKQYLWYTVQRPIL